LTDFGAVRGHLTDFGGSQENTYSSWMEQARELGLGQIEREQFPLSNGHIKIKNRLTNVFRIPSTPFCQKLNFCVLVKGDSSKQDL
jgi:hypothetical protein